MNNILYLKLNSTHYYLIKEFNSLTIDALLGRFSVADM